MRSVNWKITFASLGVGWIFALSLGLAGMTQPENVRGFLDVFGNWNPALLWVMVGAIGVHGGVYLLIARRPRPLLSEVWHLPKIVGFTPQLFIGAAMFGVGWGISGYCPGPAIVSLASWGADPLIFFAALVAGMLARSFLFRSPGATGSKTE